MKAERVNTHLGFCIKFNLNEGLLPVREFSMGQVRVAKFTVFDFTDRSDITSARYARLDTIAIIGGRPIRGTEILVDETDIDEIGMTKLNFVPNIP